MHYIKITSEDIDLSKFGPIDLVYLEIDNNGSTLREIGLDNNNMIVHKYPSESFEYGIYGIFDMNAFDLDSLESEISKENFEKIWG